MTEKKDILTPIPCDYPHCREASEGVTYLYGPLGPLTTSLSLCMRHAFELESDDWVGV